MIVRSIFAASMLSAFIFAGCAVAGGEEPAPEGETAQAEDDMQIGQTGSAGFTCSYDGGTGKTTCTCTAGVDCKGMRTSCSRRGKSVTCTYPPSGPGKCTCQWDGVPLTGEGGGGKPAAGGGAGTASTAIGP
jgi:hypothetical protein